MSSLPYFAYGSNMSTPRLRQRLPGIVILGRAELRGYQLLFHKVGSVDGSGKCGLIPGAREDQVHGVVFGIDAAQQALLNRIEGVGQGYLETRVTVRLANGGTLSALSYEATELDPGLRPFHWYKQHVLRGAREHQLPDQHIRLIEGLESIPDPDPERHRSEMAIYGQTGH